MLCFLCFRSFTNAFEANVITVVNKSSSFIKAMKSSSFFVSSFVWASNSIARCAKDFLASSTSVSFSAS